MEWEWKRDLIEAAPARLIVTPSTWKIEAYLPGPDARHSGKFWRLSADEIEGYANALISAWKRLIELEATAPVDVSVTADGGMGIRIIVRGYPGRGVTLQDSHGLVCTEMQLIAILAELRALPAEAARVQTLLLPLVEGTSPYSVPAAGRLREP